MLIFLRAGTQFSGIMVCLDAVMHACTPTATSQRGITALTDNLQILSENRAANRKKEAEKNTLVSQHLFFAASLYFEGLPDYAFSVFYLFILS